MRSSNLHAGFLAMAIVMIGVSNVRAHFPWLTLNEDGRVNYFFGEDLSDRHYHLPASIAEAKFYSLDSGKLQAIENMPADTNSFVGLESKQAVERDADIYSTVTFGVYHGSKLTYYSQYLGNVVSELTDATPHLDTQFQAQAIATKDAMQFIVYWDREPLQEVEVKLMGADGKTLGTCRTNASGQATFSNQQIPAGLNGIIVGPVTKNESGTHAEAEYSSASHYLTACFVCSGTDSLHEPPVLAELPFGITSFGAARLGDSLYVYGGHTGTAHEYSSETQSNQLLKLNVTGEMDRWQVVADGERMQGLAMVAHDTRLIVIGGLAARNSEGEPQDLHSLTQVRAFDVETKEWSDLPSLPEGRSSHDAAIIGDRVYVVGGWNMEGDKATEWHTSALMMDLGQASPVWTHIATPPFQRRALALAEYTGKLYTIGGMNEADGPTRSTAYFDANSGQWSEGPDLIGDEGMNGFGAAAWSIQGRLIVTNNSGCIQVLSSDGKEWQQIGVTQDARFFHRLLPFDNQSLVALGGANMKSGKFTRPEVLVVTKD